MTNNHTVHDWVSPQTDRLNANYYALMYITNSKQKPDNRRRKTQNTSHKVTVHKKFTKKCAKTIDILREMCHSYDGNVKKFYICNIKRVTEMAKITNDAKQNRDGEKRNNRRIYIMRATLVAAGFVVVLAMMSLLMTLGITTDTDQLCMWYDLDGGHNHDETCFNELICVTDDTLTVLHTHSDECYENAGLTLSPEFISSHLALCGKLEHAHDDGCLGGGVLLSGCGEEVNCGTDSCCVEDCEGDGCEHEGGCRIYSEPSEDNCISEEHNHSVECYSLAAQVLECDIEYDIVHAHTDECYITHTDIVCGIAVHECDANCQPPVTMFMPFSPISRNITNRWDLNNFTSGVVIKDADGNQITGGTLIAGENYTLEISFRERPNLQFQYDSDGPGGVLRYQLPEFVSVEPVQNGEIRGPQPVRAQLGRYNIESGGLITARFDNVNVNGVPTAMNFIDIYHNAEFTMVFSAVFEATGGSRQFHFGNNITINIDVIDGGVAVITKAADNFNPETRTVDYTVTITARHGDIRILQISDLAVRLSGDPANLWPGGGNHGYQNISLAAADWQFALDGQIYRFTPRNGHILLPKDETITITYRLSLSEYIQRVFGTGDYDFTVRNTVTVEYLDHNDEAGTREASANVRAYRTLIRKSARVAGSGIIWTINAGDGSTVLNGAQLQDVISLPDVPGAVIAEYLNLTGATYQITLRGRNGQVLATAGAATATANGFNYTIPDSPANIYYVDIVYTTAVVHDLTQTGSTIFRNTATLLGVPAIAEARWWWGQIPRPLPTIDHEVSILPDEGVLRYTVTFFVPWGWQYQNLSIDKQLTYVHGIHFNSTQFSTLYYTDNLQIVSVNESAPTQEVLDTLNLRISPFWRLIFGHGIHDANTSNWPYATDTTVVFTYDLSMSNLVSSSINWPGGMTIERWLKGENPSPTETYRQTHERSVITRTTIFEGNSRISDGYDDPLSLTDCRAMARWPIFKEGPFNHANAQLDRRLPPYEFRDNGDIHINYSVQIGFRWNDNNTNHVSVTGLAQPRPYLANMLFRPGQPAMFEDTFDPRLQYIPGTFRVSVLTRNGNALANTALYTATPTISGGKMTVDLRNISQLDLTSLDHAMLLIEYTMRMPSSGYAKNPDGTLAEDLIFNNTAGIRGTRDTGLRAVSVSAGSITTAHNTASAGLFTSDHEVIIRRVPVVDKTVSVSGNLATFEIALNPDGIELAEGNNLIVSDTMSNILSVFLDSLRVFTSKTGDVYGSERIMTLMPDVDPDALWTYAMTGENEFTMVLPDETPLWIVYDAMVRGGATGTFAANNFVEVSGSYFFRWGGTLRVDNVTAAANVSRGTFHLYKHDARDARLDGAEFALYVSDDVDISTYPAIHTTPPSTLADGTTQVTLPRTFSVDGVTFHYVDASFYSNNGIGSNDAKTIVTDSGLATFDNPLFGAVNPDTIFAFVELKAPGGYAMPARLPGDGVILTVPDELMSVTFVSYTLRAGLHEIGGRPVNQVSDFARIENLPLPFDPEDALITALKEIREIRGGALPEGLEVPRFTYSLYELSADGYPLFDLIPGGLAGGLKADANGIPLINLRGYYTIEFPAITQIENPGTYYFILTEDPYAAGADPDEWVFSQETFLAVANIFERDRVLVCEIEYYRYDEALTPAEHIENGIRVEGDVIFINHYIENDEDREVIWVPVEIDKQWHGNVSGLDADGMFVLRRIDDADGTAGAEYPSRYEGAIERHMLLVPLGDYRLFEVSPDGYMPAPMMPGDDEWTPIPGSPIKWEYKYTLRVMRLPGTDIDVIMLIDENDDVIDQWNQGAGSIEVLNIPAVDQKLPSTGGAGTWMHISVGIALIAISMILAAVVKRGKSH